MHKRWLLVLLQTAVTVGLLAFFFRDAEFRADVLKGLRNANPGWLVLGVAIAGVENLLGVFRWRIFLRMLSIEVPFWKSFQVCLVALFCNTFLLGAAGGDLVRAAYLIRRGANKTDSLLSVMLDRISGLGALILYTCILAAIGREWLSHSPTAVLAIQLVIAYQIVCAGLILASLYLATHGFTERPPRWAPFPELLRKMGAGYAKMAYQWGSSLRASGLSLIMLAGYFAVFYCSARAFRLDISFLHLSTIMPIVDVVSALPISIGGLGVREHTFAKLLGELVHATEATAFSVSLIGYLLNTSWGLAGAAILPLFKGIVRDARTTTRPTD
jgi:uncharacterized protein (TIRG00374 family)